jgi:hypothetical protein
MAVLILHREGPRTRYDGTLVQTPRSGSDRVGTYAEVVDSASTPTIGPAPEVIATDASSDKDVLSVISDRSYVNRDSAMAQSEDNAVDTRLAQNIPVFIHLVAVETSFVDGWEDWLDVALVDGSVPEEQTGYELDDGQSVSDVSLYEIETSMRDAVQLGKAQRSLEEAGGDTTLARAIQYVHPDVEAPISLFSRYIHADSDYALYRPGAIFQTTIAGLVSARGDIFDADTHLSQAGITPK